MLVYDDDFAIDGMIEINDSRVQLTSLNASRPYLVFNRQMAPLKELVLKDSTFTNQTDIKGSLDNENLRNKERREHAGI